MNRSHEAPTSARITQKGQSAVASLHQLTGLTRVEILSSLLVAMDESIKSKSPLEDDEFVRYLRHRADAPLTQNA